MLICWHCKQFVSVLYPEEGTNRLTCERCINRHSKRLNGRLKSRRNNYTFEGKKRDEQAIFLKLIEQRKARKYPIYG